MLTILGIVLGSCGFFTLKNNFTVVFIIMVASGGIIFMIGFGNFILGTSNDSKDECSDRANNMSIQKIKEIIRSDVKTKVLFEYIYLETTPPEKTICMITKIPLDNQKDILLCPHCESYFLGTYLSE